MKHLNFVKFSNFLCSTKEVSTIEFVVHHFCDEHEDLNNFLVEENFLFLFEGKECVFHEEFVVFDALFEEGNLGGKFSFLE